jgi:hypothetical protein
VTGSKQVISLASIRFMVDISLLVFYYCYFVKYRKENNMDLFIFVSH